MIVRRLHELPDDRVVSGETWTSRRLLLRDEGMGFSLHDTLIEAGTRTHMCYANHLESVYCIEGQGTLTVVGNGEVFQIGPGTVYALDQHDEHVLVAQTRLRMICVFNPPLAGPEVHDANGTYPLID